MILSSWLRSAADLSRSRQNLPCPAHGPGRCQHIELRPRVYHTQGCLYSEIWSAELRQSGFRGTEKQ